MKCCNGGRIVEREMLELQPSTFCVTRWCLARWYVTGRVTIKRRIIGSRVLIVYRAS